MSNDNALKQIGRISTAGFYLGLRIGFAFPVFEKNVLPEKWIRHYTSRGLMLIDPVMHWVHRNSGAIRWTEMAIEDPRGVMQQAKQFGLNYGAAVSCIDTGVSSQRSFGIFAREDRELLDAELAELESIMIEMHASMVPPSNLTKAELEALGMVKDGLLMKEIANFLGVSEGAVKQRLKNAKVKLKAKTSTHAATMASSFGLI